MSETQQEYEQREQSLTGTKDMIWDSAYNSAIDGFQVALTNFFDNAIRISQAKTNITTPLRLHDTKDVMICHFLLSCTLAFKLSHVSEALVDTYFQNFIDTAKLTLEQLDQNQQYQVTFDTFVKDLLAFDPQRGVGTSKVLGDVKLCRVRAEVFYANGIIFKPEDFKLYLTITDGNLVNIMQNLHQDGNKPLQTEIEVKLCGEIQ